MKIQNLERFRRKLRNLPKVARDEIRKALEKSADEVVDLMKRMVPVDQGTLRDSIGWTWGEAPDGAMVFSKVAAEEGFAITIYAGNNATYVSGSRVDYQNAFLQEFGSVNMKANPFFRPAWRLNKKRAQSRVRRSIGRAARKVAAGS